NVVENQTTTVPEDQCQLIVELKIAVVTGIWDDVGSVLDSIGIDPNWVTTYDGNGGFFTSSTWNADLLEDYATLSSYDIVFINCGAEEYDYLDSTVAA